MRIARIMIGGVLLMCIAACVERKERIVVHADGRVEFTASFDASSYGELYDGDAVPSLEGGWIVVDRIVLDDEGNEHFLLDATAAYPAGADLASNYSPPRDPSPDVALQFPTSLTIEERSDGTYYHFRRVYAARSWAQMNGPLQAARDRVNELMGDRELGEMPPGDQAAIIGGFARIEALKMVELANLAYRDVMTESPQDVWLRMRAALMNLLNDLDLETLAVLALLAEQNDDAATKALDDERTALQARAVEAMRQTLSDSGLFTQSKQNEFMVRYQFHARFHEITEDLADDRFEIKVEMPGRIIGHNGDGIAGGSVTWTFGGDAVRDRRLDLLVTSVVLASGS